MPDNLPSFEDTQPIEQEQALPKFEETQEVPNPDASLPTFENTKPIDSTANKYDNPEQQVKAGLEGAAQGLAGPLAPLFETKIMGVKPEDIAGRAEANPITHGLAEFGTLAGSMLTGAGEVSVLSKLTQAGIVAKSAEAAAELANLGKVGSALFKGAIEGAGLQASDEISKAILGQGSPEAPVSNALINMSKSALLGGMSGGLFNTIGRAANSGLKAIENAKMGESAQAFLNGVGAAAKGHTVEEIAELAKFDKDSNAFKLGAKFHNDMPEKIAEGAIKVIPEAIGAATGSYWAFEISKHLEPVMSKVLKAPLMGAGKKYVIPTLTKALASGQVNDMVGLIDYANNIGKGVNKMTAAMDSLFKSGGQQSINAISMDNDKMSREKEKISEFVENGGMNDQIQQELNEPAQPGYAKGGMVSKADPDTFSTVFPTENVLLQAAKGRISGYLGSVRPKPSSGMLPFDKHRQDPIQAKSYDRALEIAANPIGVLEHVKKGTLTSEHVKHISQMYPEIYNHLSKEMTKRITMHGMDEENKPSYKTRQAMSLFMTTPLEKVFTPPNIQAAQSVFIPRSAPQQPAQGASKMKRGTAKLGSKTNNLYQTQSQESERDRSDRN